MTVVATWDDKQRAVIRYIHYGNWTWAEVDAAVVEAQAMLRGNRRQVHVIIDLRESATIEDSEAARQKHALSIAPGRETEVIFVGPRKQARVYYSVMRHRYKGRRTKEHFHFTQELDEAKKLLVTPAYST